MPCCVRRAVHFFELVIHVLVVVRLEVRKKKVIQPQAAFPSSPEHLATAGRLSHGKATRVLPVITASASACSSFVRLLFHFRLLLFRRRAGLIGSYLIH